MTTKKFPSKPPLQPCGTPAAVRRHRKKGEALCDACRTVDQRHRNAARVLGPKIEAHDGWDRLKRKADGPQSWMNDAACRGMDPNIFFPDRGGDTTEPQKVCASCPVREQCLDYSWEIHTNEGIWGGLTGRQRRSRRKQLREAAV